MSVAEAAILQEVVVSVELIELLGYVTAASPRLDELDTTAVDLAVDVPQTEVLVTGVVKEQGPLQGGVITVKQSNIPGKRDRDNSAGNDYKYVL